MIGSWQHYLWNEDVKLNTSAVTNFENHTGIKYPVEYLELLQSNQGKTPEKSSITLSNGIHTEVSCLLHFSNDDYDNAYNVIDVTNTLEESLPNLVIPFADSPGGDYFCFDFRNSIDNPSIVFFFHELTGDTAITPISDSFTSFLAILEKDS